MTVDEIFADINAHMIKGVMLHDEFAEYFDFLGLRGFRCEQEYHAFSEFCERRGLVRYFVNHFGKLIPDNPTANPNVIPSSWRGLTRMQIDAAVKKRAVRDAFVKWREWETETKKLYEKSYKDLCDIGEVAAAYKIKKLLSDVDAELKGVECELINLESIGYDLPSIFLSQNEINDKYVKKRQLIEVTSC